MDKSPELTPEEKRRAAARARNRAWIERNPEKYRECAHRASRKHYESHKEECQQKGRELARKYYYAHRAEILARQKEYARQNREKINERSREYVAKNPEKRKETVANYTARNRDKIQARRRENRKRDPEKNAARWRKIAPEMAVKRKAKYIENPYPARQRAHIYYVRAMAARAMAKNVCPVFRYVLGLKDTNIAEYKRVQGPYYALVQRAISCPALTVVDAKQCPMVKNPEISNDEMLASCTLANLFQAAGAWNGARAQALLLRKKRKVK